MVGWAKLNFGHELDGGAAPELGMHGLIFLASHRSTLYLVLATDELTLNMNTYSDRQLITK
jgi:hypothetical protein